MRAGSKIIVVAFLFLVRYSLVHAQVKGDLIEQSLDLKFPFTITQFSTKHGLPQNQVVHIAPKKNGNLLLGTANGIVEYNGIAFKSFIPDDRYKTNIFTALFWHEPTQQLFGQQTDGLLSLVYPGQKVYGKYCSQLKDDSLFSIGPGGKIFKSVITARGPSFDEVGSSGVKGSLFIFRHQRSYYLGTINGLFVYNEKTQKTTKILDGIFLGMAFNPYNKKLYVIEATNIYVLDKKPEVFLTMDQPNGHFQDIAFTETGEHCISTNVGLYIVGKGNVRLYDKKAGMPSQTLLSLYYNATDRCLYMGTSEKGLLRLQFKSCFTYSAKEGFPETCFLNSIVQASTGEMLIAGSCGNIFQVDSDSVFTYTPVTADYCSLGEADGKIYAGTWGSGLKVIRDKELLTTINEQNGQLPHNNVHSFFKDSKGYYWVGTGMGIACGRSEAEIRPFLRDKITQLVLCFYERRNGEICIGGSNGLYLLDKKHQLIQHLDKKQGLLGKEVRGLYEDREGKLWIGMYDGGVYCYEKGKLTHVGPQKNAMLDIDAFCFAPDGHGYLYISSNHGLWRAREKDLNDFYRGKIPYLVPFFYSEEDGILNTEFNGGFQNNYLRTKNNHLYFSNMQGLIEVVPEIPAFRKLQPVMQDIFVNEKKVNGIQEALPRNTSSIRFDFSSNGFPDRYNVYYQYKIERNNEQGEWSALQRNGSVNFNALQHGNYTFTLRAIDAFNDRNPSELKYTFEISPYFYETAWFFILFGLAFLSVIALFGRTRMRTFKRKAEEKERHRRQLAELEIKAIHDRMNPHFVFNSLNSIKYYLSVNDHENANKYLDGFSILLRKFTEYSNQNFITVREEMEIITTYVRLEQMRMSNAFESRIDIDPAALDKQIPTINIQPFVENAIKHGIAHSTKHCYLHISIKVNNGVLYCVVDDNGIGRKRSQEINAGRQKHQSRGLKMVEEKKLIIQDVYKINVTIDIHDKVNEQGEAAGTTVTIKIPIKS